MGYLFDAMDKVRKTIKERFRNRVNSYMPYISIIESRWDRQMQSPLHVVACFLNPGIYFRIDFVRKLEVSIRFLCTMMKLVPNGSVQERIMVQLESYKKSTNIFGSSLAIRMRTRLQLDIYYTCSVISILLEHFFISVI